MVIGLERGVARLVPYSPLWPELYAQEERFLRGLIGPYVLDIQHIGSTAIPGMIAKPILDIGVAIEQFEEGAKCIGPIESLGYEYEGENGIPRRHYFDKGNPTTHHLHMLERDSEEWANHIVFRDFMRANPALAKEYAALKKELAEKHRYDRTAYTDGKAAFIRRVLKMARERDAHA